MALLWTGNAILAFALVIVLFLSILYCNEKIFDQYNKYLYLLMIFSISAIGASLIAMHNPQMFYMIPFTLAALFLLAFFFYIDGVYTIIEMATAYGEALGLGSSSLLMALQLTQMVAFPCCIMFRRLSGRFDSAKLILVCITGYMFITLFAVFMTTETEFWILAFMVGIFQGGIQALSRSHFSKIIPPERSGEYFGVMDVFF